MSLRFQSFEMRRFGPFERRAIDFGDGGGALHIVCGPNEIGKSTTQRAIGDFLFGIPIQSRDGHEFGYEDMRLVATVLDTEGNPHQLVRRKGKSNTLLGPDGEPLDEGVLAEMVGGLDRDAFTSMFSITHKSLVEGGKALLAADGNLGESLFSASLGAAGLNALRADLKADAAALFKPNATSVAIAETRSAIQKAQERLKEATLRTTPYLRHGKELRAAESEREDLVGELQVKREEQRRSERLQIVLPKLNERTEALRELESFGDLPALPADSEERRVRAEQDLATHRRRVNELEERVESLTAEAQQLDPNPQLLQREQAIETLAGRLENAREASSDLERQSTKVEAALAAARATLTELDAEADLKDAARLKVSDSARTEVASSLQNQSGISAKLAQAQDDEREAKGEAAEIESRLKALEEPPNVVQLAIAVEGARPNAKIEEQIADARTRLADAEEDLKLKLSELRPAVKVDALLDVDWPDRAALDEFAVREEGLSERGRDLCNWRERSQRVAQELAGQLRAMTQRNDLPDQRELSDARERRDALWGPIRARLDGGAEEQVDPQGFEERLSSSDRIADRLREQADEVAARAQIEERRAANRSELETIEEATKTLAGEREAFDAQWSALWAAGELTPRAPAEMRAWVDRRALVVERVSALKKLEREISRGERIQEKHVAALLAALRELPRTEDRPKKGTLLTLIALADRAVGAAGKLTEDRDRLEYELTSMRARVEKLANRIAELRAELDEWGTEWGKLVDRLGWSNEIGPEQAPDQLRRAVDLTNALEDAEDGQRRIGGIKHRIASFEEDVSELLSALGDVGVEAEGADAVAELARRLKHAKSVEQLREVADSKLLTAQGELEDAKTKISSAESEISGLAELANVSEPEELRGVERSVARVGQLNEKLPRLEDEIVKAGKAELEELVSACAELDVDELDARVLAADDEVKRAEESQRELDVRIGALEAEQRVMENGPSASLAAQELERLHSELRALTATYLKLHVAEWVLTRSIDEYRRTHKAPLLERAEELFPRLTDGKYKGLEVSFDDKDQPVLVGVRSNDKRVSVRNMSEGPREQLYLSLRQASIERHVDLFGAVPVILDDVVLHSDPTRKKAILRSLSQLGERTQVIAFSHDPQVKEIARASVNPDLLKIHDFGDRQITGELQSEIPKADVHQIRQTRAA